MGFLDNVKKGLDDAAKGLNKAVSGTNVPSPPPPGAPGANDVDPDFIDGLAPQTWLPMAGTSLDDIVASDEVFFGGGSTEAPTFGEPQVFEIDDAIVARYASTDGSTTIDLASIKESAMIAAGSSDGVCETYGSRLATCGRHDGLGDVSVEGSNGPGHAQIVACVGDLAARCDLYGDASIDVEQALVTVHNVLFMALRQY